jgi:hypothetical protein
MPLRRGVKLKKSAWSEEVSLVNLASTFVGAPNGEKTSTRASSDAEGMRMRGAETRVEDPELQGIQKRG